MVPLLKTKGFTCHVDEAVFGTGREGYAHLLSLVGSREAVKAIWARLMKGETTVLHNEVRTHSVRMNPRDGGKLLTERLPSGAFHGLLLSKTVLRGELVICEHEEGPAGALLHAVVPAAPPAAARLVEDLVVGARTRRGDGQEAPLAAASRLRTQARGRQPGESRQGSFGSGRTARGGGAPCGLKDRVKQATTQRL